MTVETSSIEYIFKVFTVLDKAIKNEEENLKKRKPEEHNFEVNPAWKKKKIPNTEISQPRKRKQCTN